MSCGQMSGCFGLDPAREPDTSEAGLVAGGRPLGQLWPGAPEVMVSYMVRGASSSNDG